MSPEQARQRAREIVGGCACHVGYKRRDKIDPDCPWHRYGEDITTALLAVHGERRWRRRRGLSIKARRRIPTSPKESF